MTTDSSQQLMLVQQKVDLLQDHMNWVIGGVTLTITFLLALFALIQFIYKKKLDEKRIQEVEKKLNEKIEKEISSKEEILKNIIESKVSATEETLTKQIRYLEADVCRRFAIDCSNGNIPSIAFGWWIRAAALYAEHTTERQLLNISIKEAKNMLEKINTKFDVDSLLEFASNTHTYINELRKKYPTEAGVIEKLFTEKVNFKPSDSVIQA